VPRSAVAVFAAVVPLLAVAVVGCGCTTRTPPPPAAVSVPFTDATVAAGIRFTHQNGAAGKKLLPETMSGGVVVLDFDADGRPDLFFVNGGTWPGSTADSGRDALYRNAGGGKFEDASKLLPPARPRYAMGGCAADFDNDGFPDLFVTAVGGNRLYHNAGGKGFEDVTERAGLTTSSWPTAATAAEFEKWNRPVSFPSSATWLDYDGDGKLDLFVCNYVTWSPANDLAIRAVLPGGVRAYVPPTQFPGTHCQLFRNLGDGRFREVTFDAGIEVSEPTGMNGAVQPVGKALGVIQCDPDGDGWPDLLVANDTVRNFFFHNVPDGTGGRKFEEIGLAANAAYSDGRPRGGMGIDAAYLNGKFAAVIANFSNEPNTLLTLADPKRMLFQDAAAAAGLAAPSRGPMKFGAFFFDADLDGRPDLLTLNGHLEPDIGLARTGQTQAEPPQLFRGLADGRFELVTDAGDLGAPMVARGSAYLDFDGDGRLDVAVVANGGSAKLFRNATSGNNWVRLKLVGDGKKSNRDAIGATAEVTAGGEVRRFHVTGSRGYQSQSELVLTVGLVSGTKVDSVTVKWPGQDAGKQTWSDLKAGKEHRLDQK
jgi:hypothetical protein